MGNGPRTTAGREANRVLSRGFLAALPSPLRRIPAALYATTPNAAHHHCIMHGEALPQLRFSPPPLHERRTVRLALSGGTSATPQRPIFQEQSRARLTAPRSASNRLAASGRLAPRQVSCDIWALQLRPRRDDRAHRSCWQVCRPGSVATRWEYRNNPLVDLEKVRAFTSRHACTLPSHCLIYCASPSYSTVPILWERLSGVLCAAGGCAAASAHRAPGGGGGHLFSMAQRCTAAPQA